MDKSQGNKPRDTVYSVDESIHVQGENEQEEEDLEDRRRREAELHNIISTRLGNISYDDDQSINSTSFDSTSISRYQSNLGGDAYKDASLNSFEQLQVMYEMRVNEQKELRKTIDEMEVQHKADSDEITRKMYLLEADFNRVQFLYQQAQEVLGEKNLDIKQKEMRLAELTHIVTDLTASRNQLQGELSSWKETHTALEQKLQLMEKGLNKKAPEKEIRSHYEQELSKLQESIRVTTRKYESAKIEIKLLRERVHEFDENEKQLFFLRKKLNKESHICVDCSDFFKEICNLESNMGITKEVETVKLTPGETLTHDQNEAILKQYLNTLRQLMDIFPEPGEVDKLQAEVASLAHTLVLLKEQFGEKKPDADVQVLLEQKDLDICDLKDIIVKLQAEKEVVDNDMKGAILALNRKENKVVELMDSLAQLTQDEMKFESDIFEQEKLRGEVKGTSEQEVYSLDGMINQILTLTEHLQKQVAELKTPASIECGEKLSDIYITTKKLKEADKAFKNNLVLKMSVEDVENRKIEAFAQKVSYLNQHRTDLEQDLIEHLAGYVESNKLKDDHAQRISERLEELSTGNVNLQHQLAVESQERTQLELDKDKQILQLQKQLDKITLGQKLTDKNESQTTKEKDKKIQLLQKQIEIVTEENIKAQKTIIARDEELASLSQGDLKISAIKSVPQSLKKVFSEATKPVLASKKPILAAKSKFKNPIDLDEESIQINELIAKKNTELANLRKEVRMSEGLKPMSPLPENPTKKTNIPIAAAVAHRNQKVDIATKKIENVGSATNKNQKPGAVADQINSDYETSPEEQLNTKENELEYRDLLQLYNEYDQKFVLQEKFVDELKTKITALKAKLKEFEKASINPRRIEHFEQENLRLQGQNANLNSDLSAAQMQIIEMSEKIEQFESQGELIEDMKKKSHIFQVYMNEQIALRLTQPPANSVAVTNTATNTSDLASESINGTKQARRLEVFNKILERKNDQYRILLEENKCLKEKISFDRSALNDLTVAWNNEIDRLKIFAHTNTKKNLELVEQVKMLSNSLTTCQQLFQSVSSKLACANEIVNQFYETLEEPNSDFHQLQQAMAGFLIGLKSHIGNCLENNRP